MNLARVLVCDVAVIDAMTQLTFNCRQMTNELRFTRLFISLCDFFLLANIRCYIETQTIIDNFELNLELGSLLSNVEKCCFFPLLCKKKRCKCWRAQYGFKCAIFDFLIQAQHKQFNLSFCCSFVSAVKLDFIRCYHHSAIRRGV